MVTRILILSCWLVFAIFWLVNSFSTKKTAWRQGLGGELAHRIPLVVGMLLVFRPRALPSMFPAVIAPTPMSDALAVSLCLLGVAGAIWARRTLARNWSGTVTLKQNHELVTTGPYRFVRHPIYTSIILMALGTAISNGHPGAFIGVLLVFASFFLKLKQEEKLMLSHFPGEYATYMTHSKAIIPFVL